MRACVRRRTEHARGRLSALVLRAIINNQDLSGRVTLVHERGERLLQEGHVAKARHDHRDVVRRRREARRTLRHAFGALRKRSQRVASALAEAVQRADCCGRTAHRGKHERVEGGEENARVRTCARACVRERPCVRAYIRP
eukprot:6175857-Pleurochrysis_carterae.AAC.4